MEKARYWLGRTLGPVRPRSSGRTAIGHSPRFPAHAHHRLYRLPPSRTGRRTFADYLSISDRYSTQTNFDSENTIGDRFRVNRDQKRNAAFLPTVILRQQ